MKDSIHKKLVEHIRKAVGQHELLYEPGSWEEFQRLRHRRKQRQPLIGFRYALAACLLIGVLGIPFWLYVKPLESMQQAHKSSQIVTGKSVPTRQPGESVVLEQRVTNERAAESSKYKQKELPQNRIAWKTTLPPQKQPSFTHSDHKSQAVLGRQPSNNQNPNPDKPTGNSSDEKLSVTHIAEPAASSAPLGSFEKISARSMRLYRWPLRPLGLPLHVQPEVRAVAKIAPAPPQNLILGVSLAPQSVYAAGSAPSVAVGGGLFSEIPLSKRLSLSTGLSMVRQTLGTKTDLIAMSTTPVLVATDVRLMAVDLPLNVRFRPLKSSKTGLYAEAGVSSLAFLRERYADTYQQMKEMTILVVGSNGQEQTVTQYVTQQQTVNRSEPAFQRIYWGRIVNLSIGIERRIGSQFRLAAEPYLKYPVGPFTRENLLLGSGGVSLRLGFQAGR